MKKLSTTAEELKTMGLEVDYLVDGVKTGRCPSQQEWGEGRVMLSFGPPVTPLEDREDYKAGAVVEREACAKILDAMGSGDVPGYAYQVLSYAAKMIRARGR